MHNEETLQYQMMWPASELADFVYCFSSLKNLHPGQESIIIPNGKIDLIFSKTTDGRLRIALMGLETKPKPARPDVTGFFAISFNPLAVAYIFGESIAGIINSGKIMPEHFWDFTVQDLEDFTAFCEKASRKITSLLPGQIDGRKKQLFDLIQATDGEIAIKEIAAKINWSERQINRYFNSQYGLSLKTYCSILRFQASLQHISEGQLYPQLNFADQSHFIKEIKKLSGVSPKELFKNPKDRFLQFLVYHRK